MFSLLKTDPIKRLEKEVQKKMAQAVELQRNGKIKEFAQITEEIEALQKSIDTQRQK